MGSGRFRCFDRRMIPCETSPRIKAAFHGQWLATHSHTVAESAVGEIAT